MICTALLCTVAAAVAPVYDETWTLANLSNVYSTSYQNPHVHEAGKDLATELECRAACAAETSCNSYTWTPGPQAGANNCRYTHNCWWRDDAVWALKDSTKCMGMSGYKGTPPQPGPSPSPSPPSPSPAPSPAPPGALNVLFVIFDDLRVMHKPWGFNQTHTPNTDAFAAKSLAFDNAYCNQAVCGPSRASLVSGRRPDTTQMWNFEGSFRDTHGASKWNTWPQWFKNHGYYTAGCGKIFHPGDPENFDPQSWTGDQYGGYYGQDHCEKGCQPQGFNKSSHGCPIDTDTCTNHTFPDIEALNQGKADLATAAAAQAAQRAASAPVQPFWIGVGFVKPHMPHVFPAKYLDMVPPNEEIELAKHQLPPTGIAASMDWHSGAGANGPASMIGTPADAWTQRDWRQNYYAAAAFSDDMFGQLLDGLDEHGFTDNTLVIMTADHGWGLGEHNHWVKYTNWETDARVPLIVHHPNAPKSWGMHTRSLVEHVDLYPTFAELAGIPVTADAHESIEGSSYASLFGTGVDPSSTVWTSAHNGTFTQYPRCGEKIGKDGTPDFSNAVRCAFVPKADFVYMGYSIRTTRWRYTEWAVWNGTALGPIWMDSVTDPTSLVELYDHEGDKGNIGARIWDDFENENVAGANPLVVGDLSKVIRSFYHNVAANRGSAYTGSSRSSVAV